MRTGAVNTLFCPAGAVYGRGCESRHDACRTRRTFCETFPEWSFASTCYLVGCCQDPFTPFFPERVEDVGRLLEEHPFLQVSLRPVHPFRTEDTEPWMALYERFLLVLGPFQKEGYREQIVSRLRIFPVLFFPSVKAVDACRSFLGYLKRNFFLPSLLLPRAEGGTALVGLSAGSDPEWERVYFTASDRFDGGAILETLHAHAVCDLLLDRGGADPLAGPDLCREIGVIREAGLLPACPEQDAPGGGATAGSGCLACLPRILDGTAESFRQDGREDAWRSLAARLAGAMQKRGYTAQAVPVWERCLRGRPSETVPLHEQLQLSLCRYESGDLEGAMRDLTEARRLHPGSPEVRFYMGRCEFAWRDYIEAADRFREAADLGLARPMRQEAEYLRGESHAHLEEYPEALEALRKAEEEGRADSPLHFYQGLSLLGTGDPAGAVARLRKALEAGPSDGDLFHVLFYTAHALKESGNYSEALAACVQAEGQGAPTQELYNLKGFCHFKLGQHEAAIGCFRRCIEIDPRSAIDHANIGSNLREMGDLNGAAAMYRKALSMDPGIAFARESLERIEKVLGGAPDG